MLLLDEIGGGLTDAEANDSVEIIHQLHGRGIAIVWIEHIVHILVEVSSAYLYGRRSHHCGRHSNDVMAKPP